MKGTYVNTVIWMAARSNRKNRSQAIATETIASLQSHRIIWTKNGETKKASPAKVVAMFH